MKNTAENKAKFFGQYFGQNILRWFQWLDTVDNGVVNFKPLWHH